MSRKIKWGIIGLGRIAHKFASDLLLVEGAELVAVASRDANNAKAFAEKYQSPRYYDNYEELVGNTEVEVVYIATPHALHLEHTLLCLDAGKAVLCEKPLGMNAEEVEIMMQRAREKRLFLMEALWTRFIPATEKLIQLVEDKSIGKIVSLQADFGYQAHYDPDSRLFKKSLGGGALLDIGIYPVYLSLLLLGSPDKIEAGASFAGTGVDNQCSMKFDYVDPARAQLDCSLVADTPVEAILQGEHGSIHVHRRFHHPEKITLQRDGEPSEIFNIPYLGHGYVHEIKEVMRCLNAGLTQSNKMPLNMSWTLIKTLDAVRKKIGLTYP